MRFIFLLIMIAFVTGCGTSKKISTLDSKTTLETTFSKLDTTSKLESTQSILDQVMSQIDLSKIRIVTYYPTIDSSGKQTIKEDVTIEKNIVTNSKKQVEKHSIITEDKGVKEEFSQNYQNREIEKTTEKKTGIPIKYYLIGFVVLAGIGYLAYKFIRH